MQTLPTNEVINVAINVAIIIEFVQRAFAVPASASSAFNALSSGLATTSKQHRADVGLFAFEGRGEAGFSRRLHLPYKPTTRHFSPLHKSSPRLNTGGGATIAETPSPVAIELSLRPIVRVEVSVCWLLT